MKKLLVVTALSAWVNNLMPDISFPLGKKTPWYRSSQFRGVPWLAVAFIAPFAIFLVWKGGTLLLGNNGSAGQPSDNQPPATELT